MKKALKRFISLVLSVIIIGSTVGAIEAFCAENNLKELKQEWNTISGKEPADLLIKNVKILHVYTEKISPGSMLIKNGKIVALDPPKNIAEKALKQFDGKGMYAIPGLIDSHFHIDSTMLTPAALSVGITPNGTTSVFGEVLDLSSSAKGEGAQMDI